MLPARVGAAALLVGGAEEDWVEEEVGTPSGLRGSPEIHMPAISLSIYIYVDRYIDR